jgi:hypothetical protein
MGAIEGMMLEQLADEKTEYYNVWLEPWAHNVAERLTR